VTGDDAERNEPERKHAREGEVGMTTGEIRSEHDSPHATCAAERRANGVGSDVQATTGRLLALTP
jgi:hypothetical protein